MKFGTYAWTLLLTVSLAHAAHAQISYVSQVRNVNAHRSSMSGIPPACNQNINARDFAPFDQEATCSGVHATQESTLGANTITCHVHAGSESTPGLLVNSSGSSLTVVFDISATMRYTLSGQTGSNYSVLVRLTGPSGVMHQVQTNMNFDFCGTLVSGQYEMRSSSSASAGGFSTHDFTLRIVKPGDVNGDQSVNIDDLLGVINGWGVCANPQDCPADLTCNNAVDIDDLLDVISNWG